MKISNSKKQLAKIINENGGWRGGREDLSRFAAQQDDAEVWFSAKKPVWQTRQGSFAMGYEDHFVLNYLIANRHQTILSRDEYFDLYPAPVKVVVENKTTCTLTVTDDLSIEQLAADYRNAKDYAARKQQEADAAKADAEAKLAAYVAAAGSAVGLVLSVVGPEPELVITDWRDLQVGDVIECVGDWEDEATNGKQFAVTRIDKGDSGWPIRIEVPGVGIPGTWGRDFKFIRRPAKETTNA